MYEHVIHACVYKCVCAHVCEGCGVVCMCISTEKYSIYIFSTQHKELLQRIATKNCYKELLQRIDANLEDDFSHSS